MTDFKKASVLFDQQKARIYPDEMILELGRQALNNLQNSTNINYQEFA